MANKTLDVTLIIRHASATEWAAQNPVIAKGELGYEIDTRKSKIGDGVSAWNTLKYASAGSVELKTVSPQLTDTGYDIGTIWVDTEHQKIYYLVAKTTTAVWIRIANADELAVVAESTVAQKLKTARSIALSGDVSGSEVFDGSQDVTIVIALKNSGAAAGTYTKLTIDAKGIVTGAAQLAATDIPNLTLSKITDAKTAASRDVGTAAGNVPILDAGGKLAESVIPALAIHDVFEVSTQAAMLALTAEKGDIAVRSDLNKSFILKATPATTLANWIELRTPTDSVLSVNGFTGAVTLTTGNIAEGSNKYYTEDRATANFNSNFPTKSVTGLSDGASVVLSTDTITINGGIA